MEIWLDTCETQIIKKACRLGVIAGITTNPSLLAACQENHDKVLTTLLDIQDNPVAVQVTASLSDEMVKQALALHTFSKRIIIKIPVVQEGLVAMKLLADKGIPVMATAIFRANQALLAALAGADYVAPYVSKMFDEGIEAYSVLETMISIYSNYKFKTKILAAALRTPDQITTCASKGISAVTLKSNLFSEFISDEATTLNSLRIFNEEWKACTFSKLPALA